MSSALARLIEDHHVRTWTMIGSGGGGRVVDTPDYQLTLSVLDHVPYNHVQRCTPTRDVEEVVDEVMEIVGPRDAIWSVIPSSPPDLEQRLQARGFEPFSRLAGMALALEDPAAPELPNSTTVVEVSEDMLETWADLVLDQWHLSAEDRRLLLAMHRGFGFERVQRWLCIVDGVPMAKASVGMYDPGIAGIYGVGTKPEARGRGIASALMRAVMHRLAARDVRTVVLQSTPVAVGIYRALGFEEHCVIPVYRFPHTEPGTERMART